MVKLKVLLRFRDKYTDEIYNEGDVIEVNEKRAKELLLNHTQIVEVIEVIKENKPSTDSVSETKTQTKKRKTTKND